MRVVEEPRKSVFQEKREMNLDTGNVVVTGTDGKMNDCGESLSEIIRKTDERIVWTLRITSVGSIVCLAGLYGLGYWLCNSYEACREIFGFLYGM